MSKGHHAKAQQHISDKVRAAFSEMDKNGDGVVTFSEFRDFCAKHTGLEGVAEAFCEIDTSNDCKISLEELNDLCTKKIPPEKIRECHIKDLFRELDTSGDGQLDKSEFRVLMAKCGYSESVITETFKHIAGGDGLITLDEFLHAFRNS